MSDVKTESSGLLNASGVVLARPGLLSDVAIITDGTNPVTAIIYDNATTNSGTVLYKGKVTGAGLFGGGGPSKPIRAANGLYLVLSGTGAECIVYYV